MFKMFDIRLTGKPSELYDFSCISGYDAKACLIARGKFDGKKHGFGQVHGLI